MPWENCQKLLLMSLCPSNPVHICPDTHSIICEKSKSFLKISADCQMLRLSRTYSVSISCPHCIFVLFFPSCCYGVTFELRLTLTWNAFPFLESTQAKCLHQDIVCEPDPISQNKPLMLCNKRLQNLKGLEISKASFSFIWQAHHRFGGTEGEELAPLSLSGT